MKIRFPKSRQKRFVLIFIAAVLLLSLIKAIAPNLGENAPSGDEIATRSPEAPDTIEQRRLLNDSLFMAPRRTTRFVRADGSPVRSRIYSVPGFKATFPDLNDLQLATAERLGVSEVKDRKQAEQRKDELVYIDCNPFYHVEKLRHSIPYLVPRAAHLLEHIGRNFLDSLEVKQIPLHKIIITSVLRTEDDVERLRKRNGNATERSCHLHGTTFDISYNRYRTVEDPDGPAARPVRNDTLKWVLSEVLRDLREAGTCYVKYEVKQGCYHVTVR